MPRYEVRSWSDKDAVIGTIDAPNEDEALMDFADNLFVSEVPDNDDNNYRGYIPEHENKQAFEGLSATNPR